MRSKTNRVITLLFTLFLSQFALAELPVLQDSQGKSVNLSDFKGKYVVLEWLNFECHMLKGHYEALHVQRAQKLLRKNGAVWISVLSQGKGEPGYFDSDESLQKSLYIHSWEGNFAVKDTEGAWGKHFLAKKTPFHVLIAPDGSVIYKGALDSSNPFTHSESSLKKAKNFLLRAMKEYKKGGKVNVAFSPSYGCPIRYSQSQKITSY